MIQSRLVYLKKKKKGMDKHYHFKGGGAKFFYMEQYLIKEDNVDLKNY